MQITVDKVKIKVGDITLELSIDEAKKLRDELNSAFPVAQVFPPIVIDRTTEPTYPKPWWQNPIYGYGDSSTIPPFTGTMYRTISSLNG